MLGWVGAVEGLKKTGIMLKYNLELYLFKMFQQRKDQALQIKVQLCQFFFYFPGIMPNLLLMKMNEFQTTGKYQIYNLLYQVRAALEGACSVAPIRDTPDRESSPHSQGSTDGKLSGPAATSKHSSKRKADRSIGKSWSCASSRTIVTNMVNHQIDYHGDRRYQHFMYTAYIVVSHTT